MKEEESERGRERGKERYFMVWIDGVGRQLSPVTSPLYYWLYACTTPVQSLPRKW